MTKKIVVLALVAVVAAFVGASFAGASDPAQPATASVAAPTDYAVSAAKATSQVLRARVDSSGNFIKGSAGVSSSLILSGRYEVVFPRSLANCIYQGTLTSNSTLDEGGPGEIGISPRDSNVNGIFVSTYNSAGTSTNNGFDVIVACKPPRA